MKKGFIGFIVGVMLVLVCASAHAAGDPQISTTFDADAVQRIEIGGKLLVDLNTAIMLTVDKGKAVNWFNAGYLWGDFGDFGFAKYEYPTVGIVDGIGAITFGPKTKLVGSPVVPQDKINEGTRGNLATPDSMAATGEYAIEVWAYNPTVERNECLVSWGGGYVAYPDAKYAPAKKWHHIAIVHSGGQDTLYVDGKQQTQGKIVGALAAKKPALTPISLAGTPDGKRNFSGSIAAVRIHRKPSQPIRSPRTSRAGSSLALSTSRMSTRPRLRTTPPGAHPISLTSSNSSPSIFA